MNHRNKIIIATLITLLFIGGAGFLVSRNDVSAVKKAKDNTIQHEISGAGFEVKGSISSPDYTAVVLNVLVSSPEEVVSTEFYEVLEQEKLALRGTVIGGSVYHDSPLDGDGIIVELGQTVGPAVKNIIEAKSGLLIILKNKNRSEIGRWNFRKESLSLLDPFAIRLSLSPAPEFGVPTSLAISILGVSAISCSVYNAIDNEKIGSFPIKDSSKGTSLKIDDNIHKYLALGRIYSICTYADNTTRRSNELTYPVNE